jgi:prephenate dehydrogenase
MSGTTFKAQKIIAESILTETPELINTIISNPELRKYGEEFWRDIGRLLADSQEGKREDVMNYVKTCQEKISKNVDLNKSSKKLSNMVNLIDK